MDIAQKLLLDSPEDAEYIVAKVTSIQGASRKILPFIAIVAAILYISKKRFLFQKGEIPRGYPREKPMGGGW